MENTEVPTMHGRAFLIYQPQELSLFCRLLVLNLALKNTGIQTYARRIRLELLRGRAGSSIFKMHDQS